MAKGTHGCHIDDLLARAAASGAREDPPTRVDRFVLPSMGELLHAQAKTERFSVDRERMNAIAQDDYDNNVY